MTPVAEAPPPAAEAPLPAKQAAFAPGVVRRHRLPANIFAAQPEAEWTGGADYSGIEDGSCENTFCCGWTSWYWPMASFWSHEVMRRIDLAEPVPEDANAFDPTGRGGNEDFRRFSEQAAFLVCAAGYDAREGTTVPFDGGEDFTEVNAAYQRRVLNEEPPTLDLPHVDHVHDDGHAGATPHCVFWTQNMWCELDWWARHLNTDQHGEDDSVCWEHVQRPAVEYDFMLNSSMPLEWPEYTECMDDLPLRALRGMCPFGGNVPEEHQHELEECYARLPNYYLDLERADLGALDNFYDWVFPEDVGLAPEGTRPEDDDEDEDDDDDDVPAFLRLTQSE